MNPSSGRWMPVIITVAVAALLECLLFMGYESTVDRERLINNAVEATSRSQLEQAMQRGEPAVLVYGEVNVDKANGESCVKPEGASKDTPCYVSMTSTDEAYTSHEERYDCGRPNDDSPRNCYRTVRSWEDVDWSNNRPKTVEIHGVSLPYYLVQDGESSLSVDEMRLEESSNWDSGRWKPNDSYIYRGADWRRSYDGMYDGTLGAMVIDFSRDRNEPDMLVGFTRVSSLDAARRIGSQKGWKTFWIVLMAVVGIIGLVVAGCLAAPEKISR